MAFLIPQSPNLERLSILQTHSQLVPILIHSINLDQAFLLGLHINIRLTQGIQDSRILCPTLETIVDMVDTDFQIQIGIPCKVLHFQKDLIPIEVLECQDLHLKTVVSLIISLIRYLISRCRIYLMMLLILQPNLLGHREVHIGVHLLVELILISMCKPHYTEVTQDWAKMFHPKWILWLRCQEGAQLIPMGVPVKEWLVL